MIIDFHTHTFPDRIAAMAIEKMQAGCHCIAHTDGTQSALLASMAEAGIDASVILPVATNPTKVASINDISIAHLPRRDLIYFGCIHPDMDDPCAELRRIAKAGVRGIKIHPVFQGVNIDDVRFLRILSCAGELGLVTVMHAGHDIGFPGVVRCSPKMIRHALDQVGPVPLVLAHMGSWRQWDEAAELLSHSEVMIDTAFSLGRLTPLADAPFREEELQMLTSDAFCRIVRAYGPERVLFGTDSPWGHQKNTLDAIRALPLPRETLDAILGGNARRVLEG